MGGGAAMTGVWAANSCCPIQIHDLACIYIKVIKCLLIPRDFAMVITIRVKGGIRNCEFSVFSLTRIKG